MHVSPRTNNLIKRSCRCWHPGLAYLRPIQVIQSLWFSLAGMVANIKSQKTEGADTTNIVVQQACSLATPQHSSGRLARRALADDLSGGGMHRLA